MTDKVFYNCTALTGTNKVGMIKPDADGYYTVILGAFDFPNSAGDIYPWQHAKKLFDASSALQRRITTGQQRGEYGHPKPPLGMTKAQYITRICTIEETLISHHVKEVWIDKEEVKGPNGRPVVAVMGKVKPCGPYGDSLRTQLENPKENVAFSVRSLTHDKRIAGQKFKYMNTLVTWDYVNEPGISIATKYNNPSLESLGDDIGFESDDFDSAIKDQETSGISLESGLDIISVVDQQGFKRKVANLSSLTDW
jgi:hypothetical protein